MNRGNLVLATHLDFIPEYFIHQGTSSKLLLTSALRLLTYLGVGGMYYTMNATKILVTCASLGPPVFIFHTCRPPLMTLHSAACLNETAKGSLHE